jgi:hypothetical protein
VIPSRPVPASFLAYPLSEPVLAPHCLRSTTCCVGWLDMDPRLPAVTSWLLYELCLLLIRERLNESSHHSYGAAVVNHRKSVLGQRASSGDIKQKIYGALKESCYQLQTAAVYQFPPFLPYPTHNRPASDAQHEISFVHPVLGLVANRVSCLCCSCVRPSVRFRRSNYHDRVYRPRMQFDVC